MPSLLITTSPGNFSTVKSGFTLCDNYNLYGKGNPYDLSASLATINLSFSTSYNITGVILDLYTENSNTDYDVLVELKQDGSVVGTKTLTRDEIVGGITDALGDWIKVFDWTGVANDTISTWTIEVSQINGSTGGWKLRGSTASIYTSPFFALMSDYTQAFSSGDSVIIKDDLTIDENATWDTTLGASGQYMSYGACGVICSENNLKFNGGVLTAKGKIIFPSLSGVLAGTSVSRVTGGITFSTPSAGSDRSGLTCFGDDDYFIYKQNLKIYGTKPSVQKAVLQSNASGSTIYVNENVTAGTNPWTDGDKLVIGKQNVQGVGDTETIYYISGTPTWDGSKSTIVLTASVTGGRLAGGIVQRLNGYGFVINSDGSYYAENKMFYPSNFILDGVEMADVNWSMFYNYDSKDDEENLEPFYVGNMSIRDNHRNTYPVGIQDFNCPYRNGLTMEHINLSGALLFKVLYAVGGNNPPTITDITAVGYSHYSYLMKNELNVPYTDFDVIAQNYDNVIKFNVNSANSNFTIDAWGSYYDIPVVVNASNVTGRNNKANKCAGVFKNTIPQFGYRDFNGEYGVESANDFTVIGSEIYFEFINPKGVVNYSGGNPTKIAETLHIKNYNQTTDDNRTRKRSGTLNSDDGFSLEAITTRATEALENVYQFLANAISGAKLGAFVNATIQDLSYYSRATGTEQVDNGNFDTDLTDWTDGGGWSQSGKAAHFASTLGTEKVTNGDFASDLSGWTSGADWSQDSGKAKHTETLGSNLISNGTFDYDLSYWTAGTGWAQSGGYAQYTENWGSNIITNGGFSGDASGWSLDSGWSYYSYNVYCDGTTSANLSQTGLSITGSKRYKVSFDVSGTNYGNVNVYFGNTLFYSGYLSDGTFTATGTTDGTPGSEFKIECQGFSGYITNVSVVISNDAGALSQSVSTTNGNRYKITAYIGGTTGTVQVKFDGNVLATPNAGAGTVTYYATASSSSSTLEFTPSNNSDCTIDDVTVQEMTISTLYQTLSLTNGDNYQISVDVGGTVGTVKIEFEGQTLGTVNAGSGVHTYSQAYSTGNPQTIVFTPSGESDCTIDDVSVKQKIFGSLSQTLSLTNAKKYQYSYYVGGSAGTLTININGNSDTQLYSVGQITGIITCDTGNPNSIVITPSSTFVGFIDKISIKEYTTDTSACELPTLTLEYDNGYSETDTATTSTSKQNLGVIVTPANDYQIINAKLSQKTEFIGSSVVWDSLILNLRKYGKIFQSVPVTLKDTYNYIIGNFTDLATNPFITESNSATVGAYTGITIDHTNKLCTIDEAHTIQELYDYSQYDLTLDANMAVPEWLTTIDGITFYSDYDIAVDGVLLSGAGYKLNLGSNTFTLENSGSTTLTVTDVNGTLVPVALTSVVSGSQCAIYKVSDDSELLNETASGTTVAMSFQHTTDIDVYVRVRKAGYQEANYSGTITANGLSIVVSQIPDGTF